MLRTLLLNMPFSSLSRPAIGISLLQARLAEEGLESRVGYPSLLLADQIGLDLYQLIDEKLSPALFAGEWLFAQYLFGERIELEIFINTLRAHLRDPARVEEFLGVRVRIREFLNECMEKFEIERYDIIGFTSTFEQNLASLALAREIKERWPQKITVFGGANCEGVMGRELLRQFSWIDFVVSGEGDLTFPELVKRLSQGLPLDRLGALFARELTAIVSPEPRRVMDMDRLPDPDYTDYFAALKESSVGRQLNPALLIETARGCWWGAKSHCTFCGLNGENMAFRAKSAERVIGELERQLQRHGIPRFLAVDNIISYQYFQTLLPRLREQQLGVSLFYETKANLRREQVRLLRDAGVLAIQPGIESLSSRVLHLMRKGVSGIQNVYLLKLCREYGVEVAWNLLFGFPGENREDYDAMAEGMRALYHLKPPGAVAQIRLDRFSPYFDHAEEMGLKRIRPFGVYHLLYPLPPEAVSNLAYFFEFEYQDGRQPASYVTAALGEAERWKANGDGDLVKMDEPPHGLRIQDTRRGWARHDYLLNGLQREVYEFCDDIRTDSALEEFARQRTGDGATEQPPELNPFLNDLVARGLMYREGRQYLSLAVPPRRAEFTEVAAPTFDRG